MDAVSSGYFVDLVLIAEFVGDVASRERVFVESLHNEPVGLD